MEEGGEEDALRKCVDERGDTDVDSSKGPVEEGIGTEWKPIF